jgi:AbrB family looped-hinge helix DNA binding protein
MVNIGITRMSSKGQIVIPQDMRQGIKEGEKLVIIEGSGKLILKKASKINENFQEDFEFAKRTDKALKRVEAGEFISMDSENLFEELAKW